MVSRRRIEEKRRKAEMETAHVFQEFVETFQTTSTKSITKTWIKAGIINKNKADIAEDDSGTLYKPLPRFKLSQNKYYVEQIKECARILPVNRKVDNHLKKKSNLESFKEELELLHRERKEKQRLKNELKNFLKTEPETYTISEQGDLNSTNLYLNNLSPNITEHLLMELFGHYGPLASVKIMWPRSEEERKRKKNCGFVAYMSRKDAERALKYLHKIFIMDCEIKVTWGKPVTIPTHPVFIPPALLELFKPPVVTGLPFNAQPPKYIPDNVKSVEDYLKFCIVKVVIPTDRTVVALIHRMVEFVAREGVPFEALMMTREVKNPLFRFLYDNQCPEHIYYRWKLYSILHGENINEWSIKMFRMFEEGSIWKPPIKHNYSEGMPKELIGKDDKPLAKIKMTLSTTQRDNLEYIIHKLTPERIKIVEGLIFCMQHSHAYEEIAECTAQSLENTNLSVKKVIARLYLISDILFNIKAKSNSFKSAYEKLLPRIMKKLCQIYEILVNKEKQLYFIRVTRVFNAWDYWKIYPTEYLEHLYKIFTNISEKPEINDSKAATKKLLSKVCKKYENTNEKNETEPQNLPGFIPSKWETIDPEIIESQAMTSKKWSQLQEYDKIHNNGGESSFKTRVISEDRRKKLRDIEVRVMEYQDKLELEKYKMSHGRIIEKVENYRRKLIRKYEDKMMDDKRNPKKRKMDMDYKRSKSSKKLCKHRYY